MKIIIDRKKAVSIHQQVRDAIEQAIFLGDLPIGSSLPSVRDLAESAGVAPMTVSKVYAELKAAGLVEARAGSGTFAADSPLARVAARPDLQALVREIDAVIDRAVALGLRGSDLVPMVAARAAARHDRVPRKRVVMVGLFAEATASYAASIAAQIGDHATVDSTTLERIAADPVLRAGVEAADLVLTFATLAAELAQLMPAARIVSTRFIPSEETRMALAAIDPMARMAVVSRFADFLPVLSLGARRFAAHVQDVVALAQDDPDMGSRLADRDVIILSTGADVGPGVARPGALRIEYRHIPDPGDIERLVVPVVASTDLPAAGGRKEAS